MEIKRCVNCMEDMSGVSGLCCPACGFNNAKAEKIQMPYAIRCNSIIQGRYLVGKMLGQGGFGITYIAFDLKLNVKVAIKEYFPMEMAARDQRRSNSLIWDSAQINAQQRQNGYDSFLKEARKIARIDSIPSIVRVRDTFIENQTAYIVMDFVEGITLKEKIARNGPMTVTECINLLRPMMEGLAQVHKKGIIHRDISADNIMIQTDGKIKLLDLGAAKDLNAGHGQSQLITKKGFSPLEQYIESGEIGPWTDVYALCATIYYCITGKMIPSALDRVEKETLGFPSGLKEPVPPRIAKALKDGLAIDAKNRIQSVNELLERLRFRKKKLWVGAVAAVMMAVILLFIAGRGIIKPDPVDTEAVAVAGTDVGTDVGTEAETETENRLVAEQLGTSSANVFNYGGAATVKGEYEYFIASDNALYVCPYNKEDQCYYPNDEVSKVCEFAAFITLSDTDVYFLGLINNDTSICRMDQDGSNIEALYTASDESDLNYLQYAKLSDQNEYLYFVLSDKLAESLSGLYRYDLKTKQVETIIDGYVYWYNIYEDTIYYLEELEEGRRSGLMKAGLAGEDPRELNEGKRFTSGFIAEDAIYLVSNRDEAILVYDMDGMPKEGYDGFYALDIDLSYNIGYGDGWIYYTSKADQSIHRVRANGTGDRVLLKDYNTVQICYDSGWMWGIDRKETDKRGQCALQMYYVSADGTNMLEVQDVTYGWMMEDADQKDFEYVEREDGIMITGYTGDLVSFSIPETIDEKTVIGIGMSAFSESEIEGVGLPDGVKTIEYRAFFKCEKLAFIGLPEGLESIGDGAFGLCGRLAAVDLPESLIEIERTAFAETMISKVHIPANVESIGEGAFAVYSSAGFTEYTVSEDNYSYTVYENALYEMTDDGLFLLSCPSGISGNFEIPDNVIGIRTYAFTHCTELTNIVIPKTVRSIEQNAFQYIGDNIKEIKVSKSCELPEDLGSELKVKYYK